MCLSKIPLDCQEIQFLASEITSLNNEEKSCCSVTICLPVAALLPVRWRRWLRRPGGRVESPSCTRFKSVIVFFEASSRCLACCPAAIGLFPLQVISVCSSYGLRFASVKLLRWFIGPWIPSLFKDFFPGFFVPTSFLPCSHVEMIFQCYCVILNDLFLSPLNIWQRLTVSVIIVPSFQNGFVTTTFVLSGFPQHIMCFVVHAGCCSELDIFVPNLLCGFMVPILEDVWGEGGSGLFLTFWRSLGGSPGEQAVFMNTRFCSKLSGKMVKQVSHCQTMQYPINLDIACFRKVLQTTRFKPNVVPPN